MSHPVPRTIDEFIKAQRQHVEELGLACAVHPKKDPYDHGHQVGTYVGALSLLERCVEFLKPKREDDE